MSEVQPPTTQGCFVEGIDAMVQSRDLANALQSYSLRREIVWALAFKAVALAVLYVAFFGPSHRIAVTPGRVAAAFVNAAPIHEGH